MRSRRVVLTGIMAGVLLAGAAAGQQKPAPDAGPGISKDQADAILQELRQIRQLLERQQARPAAAPQAPPNDRVKLSVGPDWNALGREDAPLTLVEFTDYQCPFCRQFHNVAFAELKKNYIDTGKLRFVSRDLPLDFHSNAINAAVAARCAGEQGKFWQMRETLISNHTDLSPDAIARHARSVGLDTTVFQACFADGKQKKRVQQDAADAAGVQISGTPSFVLAKTAKSTLDGVRIVGAQPYAAFEAAIKQMLGTP